MTSPLYLEHYLESLQHLPVLLQRNFKLMRELDERAHHLMRDIDLRAETMLPSVPCMDQETKTEEVGNIQKLFNKAKEYCDDKVQLAIQTYELVDKQIRRLDADLAKFEAEIQEKKAIAKVEREESVGTGGGSKKGRRKARGGQGKKKRSGGSSEDEGKKKHRVKERIETIEQPQQVGEVLDMPVDPNEPTYCLCHQVSYGEMIGCDNPDCPIEWFHFACVGLTTKPKGKWYCPKCSQDRKRK